MASQAAMAASSPWKITNNGSQPIHPSSSVGLAEFSAMMATNPAMATLYLGNIPRNFMNASFGMSGPQHHINSNVSSNPQSSPTIPQTQPNTSLSSFMSVPSMMNSNPGLINASTASALYASRLQLNNLYQNLKFQPYLQTNRFMSQMNNSMSAQNGKIDLELNCDSPNDSVPPQI